MHMKGVEKTHHAPIGKGDGEDHVMPQNNEKGQNTFYPGRPISVNVTAIPVRGCLHIRVCRRCHRLYLSPTTSVC